MDCINGTCTPNTKIGSAPLESNFMFCVIIHNTRMVNFYSETTQVIYTLSPLVNQISPELQMN